MTSEAVTAFGGVCYALGVITAIVVFRWVRR